MSTTTPRRTAPWLLQGPATGQVRAPAWFTRLPRWASTGGVLFVLLAVSAFVRTRYLSGQLWGDEALAVGIASHPLSAIFGVLRHAGASPLYFLILHVWIGALGSGEAATHLFSLLCGLATIPVAMWTGQSLFGRRAGFYAATLFAFSGFLTEYAQETQVYELAALLALVATAALLHGFVRRDRRYVVLFGAALTLLAYTSFFAFFFWVGLAAAVIAVARSSDDGAAVTRDAGLAFAVAFVLYLPWLPALIEQIGHATSPFAFYTFIGPTFPASLFGGDRVLASFVVVGAAALLPLLSAERRRSREAVIVWALLATIVATMLCAGLAAIFAETWVTRYLIPAVAPILLLSAFVSARTGILGLVVVLVSIAFVANAASFSPEDKSDMRDIAGELAPSLQRGDTVLVAAPEQVPLAWYYLPAGLRFATVTGPVADPETVNWTDAYSRLAAASPATLENRLVSGLAPGAHLLYTRPLTEGAEAWLLDWSGLVRRRAAQWGALLAHDPRLRVVAGARAPHNYRGACCIADSALLYTRVG